ncbi:LysR family transcriptional regulator [Acinetobacter sp. B5B]|uniref:LysR family transcriptional regulator n=1 Tax=Acinetobacter baretiae TaxID=2605383 RepID=UPI0018C278B4|nr:LysR family transcriptional regulator [Acinetobacter baretiae]MBF7682584.1 LysR family transcriptional regulator [Acinetobacter baretiae]MBF7685567.1 LysR family transcriptional regulator [Acinetobacter baretiae]
MNELRSISLFIQIVELGNFNKVAIKHGVTPQSISNSIKQLEDHLGIRLFYRTTRKNTLTEEGTIFYNQTKPIVGNIQDIIYETKTAKNPHEGLIRITATPSIGRKILLPLIYEFNQMYPLIEIELLMEDNSFDMVEHRIDLSFKAIFEPKAQVIAKRLCNIQDIACVSPRYIQQYGYPKNLDEIDEHRCVVYRNTITGRIQPWEFQNENQMIFKNVNPYFCTNNSEAKVDAVLYGLGVGLVDNLNAYNYLKTGELIPLFPEMTSERRGLYLIYAQKDTLPPRVRLFIDFMSDHISHDSQEYHFSCQELTKHKQKIHTLMPTSI